MTHEQHIQAVNEFLEWLKQTGEYTPVVEQNIYSCHLNYSIKKRLEGWLARAEFEERKREEGEDYGIMSLQEMIGL